MKSEPNLCAPAEKKPTCFNLSHALSTKIPCWTPNSRPGLNVTIIKTCYQNFLASYMTNLPNLEAFLSFCQLLFIWIYFFVILKTSSDEKQPDFEEKENKNVPENPQVCWTPFINYPIARWRKQETTYFEKFQRP